MISTLSSQLQAALALELEKLPSDMDPNEAAITGMKRVLGKINAGETGLFDPANSGDSLALALAAV